MSTQPRRYLWVINSFIVITILALGLTAYLTLVRATIYIPGEKEEFKNTTLVDLSVDEKEGAIYGEIITGEYDTSDSFPVGTASVKADKAGGTVRIINNYNRSQSLVRTTRLLSSDGKLFRITANVNVPAGGSAEVFAEADEAGDEYLIGPGKFTIPGLWEGLQDQIFAESTATMTYDRQQASTITQEDIQKAEAALTQKIITEAIEEIQTNVLKNYQLDPNQVTFKRTEIIANPAVGTRSSSVYVQLKGTVTALVFNPEDVLGTAVEKLKAQLPNPSMFIELVPDSYTYSIATVNIEEKTAQINTELAAWVRSSAMPQAADTKQLTGKTIDDAKKYLATQGVQDAEIQVFPSWMPTLPLLQDHISFKTK